MNYFNGRFFDKFSNHFHENEENFKLPSGNFVEQWRRAMEVRGMKVSRQKTEYLCKGAQVQEREVKMQGVKLNRVQELKYLGSTVQSDGAS